MTDLLAFAGGSNGPTNPIAEIIFGVVFVIAAIYVVRKNFFRK